MSIVLRPAELLAGAEGARLIGALGPASESLANHLRATLGVELTQVEQLWIAFYADDAHAPQAAFVMRLAQPIPEATLLESWGRPAAAEHHGKKYFSAARQAYWLPQNEHGRVAVIAPPGTLGEILERDGPPLLRAGIERLLRASDSARQLTILLAPSYLLTDGKSLLVGELEKLRDPLAAFLDESLEAVSFSAHLGDELFLELRAVGPADSRPEELAARLHARLDKVPERVETYVAALEPRAYGRLIVNRFPRMVQLASDFTRSAGEEKQAVLRCYLPASAAHNLLLGAELTLSEPGPTGGAAARTRASTRPAGAAAALEKIISLGFPRDTLERSLELFAKEIDTEVVILGADLQAEGITKNQSFALDLRDRPAREVLAEILKLANPDGKLVYTIRPGAGRAETIFITTRNAAAKRGERLP